MASISDFIKARKENPVWTVAWTGFLGLLYFLWTSISVIPEQSTQQKEYSVQSQRTLQEIWRANKVTEIIKDAVSNAVDAEEDYKSRTEPQGRMLIPSVESAQSGLESVEDARN